MIEALKRCSEDVTALFVGDALFGEQAYVQQLHRQVTQLGLENRVRFIGFRMDTIEISKQENGIYKCPIGNWTIGMQSNSYFFGHPTWREEYFQRTHRSEAFNSRWQKACGS